MNVSKNPWYLLVYSHAGVLLRHSNYSCRTDACNASHSESRRLGIGQFIVISSGEITAVDSWLADHGLTS